MALPQLFRSRRNLPPVKETQAHQAIIELIEVSRETWPDLDGQAPNLGFIIGLASAIRALGYEPEVALAHHMQSCDLRAAWVEHDRRAYDISGELHRSKAGDVCRDEARSISADCRVGLFELDSAAIQGCGANPEYGDPSVYLDGLHDAIGRLEATGMAADFNPSWDVG